MLNKSLISPECVNEVLAQISFFAKKLACRFCVYPFTTFKKRAALQEFILLSQEDALKISETLSRGVQFELESDNPPQTRRSV